MTETNKTLSQKLSEKASELFDIIFYWINKLKWFIVIFWIVLALSMIYCVFGFLKNTSLTIAAPKGTLGYEANEIYREKFPEIYGSAQIAVVIKQVEQLDDIKNSTYLRDFSFNFNKTAYEDEASFLIEKLIGYYIIPEHETIIENSITQVVAHNLLNGNVTVIQIEVNDDDRGQVPKFIKRLRNFVEEYRNEHGSNGYDFAVTGYDALALDAQTSILDALQMMEFIVLPIAFLILLYVVQSPVLLVIPVVNVVSIVLISFGIMYPIALSVDVFGITPAMMLSIIAATAIDYSLFLLTRYTEEINKKQPYYDAVSNMLRTSGRTVMSSGLVMLLCFSVIAIFPMEVIRYIGIGCTIAVAIALLVDLTLTPALFLCFPKFFSYQSCCPCSKRCVRYTQKRARFENWGDRMWHKFATFQSKKPSAIGMFIIALLVLLPFCVFIKNFKWTLDNNQAMPLGSEMLKGFEFLEESFPVGMLYPIRLLVYNNTEIMDVESEKYYNFTNDMINEFTGPLSHMFDETSLLCFNTAGGKVMKPERVTQMFKQEGYNNAMKYYISDDHSLVNCQLMPTIDSSMNGTKLMAEIRDHLTILENKSGYKVMIQGIMVDGVDCVNASMHYFLYVVIVLFIIILVMMIVFFKSVLVPIRVVFTTFLTLISVYGIASLVYCDDYFDFISVIEQSNGIYWITVLITVPIMVGLSLDYDIFLFSRIREYRSRGYSTKVATIYGVERTGYLITFCGLIMAVAFCGLFMSDMLVLNTFALVLVSAVLIDTFIVRTLIVPSFVHLFGELNWWPLKYETTVHEYEEADEYHAYDHLDSNDNSDDNDVHDEESYSNKPMSRSTKSFDEKAPTPTFENDEHQPYEEEEFVGNDKTPLLN